MQLLLAADTGAASKASRSHARGLTAPPTLKVARGAFVAALKVAHSTHGTGRILGAVQVADHLLLLAGQRILALVLAPCHAAGAGSQVEHVRQLVRGTQHRLRLALVVEAGPLVAACHSIATMSVRAAPVA